MSYQYPGQHYPHGQPAYPRASQATTVLVLGILGLVLCQLLGPFAWQMGNKELAAIDAGQSDPSQRGTAQAGRVCGIIATVLFGIGIVVMIFYVVVIVILLGAAATSSTA